MNSIDATSFLETGPALVKKIQDYVRATQTGFMRELPDTLEITQAQFLDLLGVEDTRSYMASVTEAMKMRAGRVKKAYLFFTPYNVMDVNVVDAPELEAAK